MLMISALKSHCKINLLTKVVRACRVGKSYCIPIVFDILSRRNENIYHLMPFVCSKQTTKLKIVFIYFSWSITVRTIVMYIIPSKHHIQPLGKSGSLHAISAPLMVSRGPPKPRLPNLYRPHFKHPL